METFGQSLKTLCSLVVVLVFVRRVVIVAANGSSERHKEVAYAAEHYECNEAGRVVFEAPLDEFVKCHGKSDFWLVS